MVAASAKNSYSYSHSTVPPAKKMVEWSRGRQLGSGSFGEVYEAIPRGKGPIMAVKSAYTEDADSLLDEQRFLEKLAGVPGVIGCHGGGYSGCYQRTYNLLLELAPYGSLLDIIQCYRLGNGFGIPETSVRNFTRSILKSLDSIHRLGVVHFDIKPGNILVFPGEDELELKLADFGLAVEMRDVDPGAFYCRGTLYYTPPEMVKYGRATTGVDVWALGCTVLHMITGHLPWKNWRKSTDKELEKKETGKSSDPTTTREFKELKKHIGKGNHPLIPDWLCEDGKDFLRWCFEERSSRPSAEILLQHKFVGGSGIPEHQRKKKKNAFLNLCFGKTEVQV